MDSGKHASVQRRTHPADTPELIAVARNLFQEYALAIGIDLEYQGFAAEPAVLPAPYVSPHGALFIA